MMDSDEGDDDNLLEDDEEELYESLVLKIIEENKLNDLKRNFLLDKDAQREVIEEEKEQIAAVASLKSSIENLIDNTNGTSVGNGLANNDTTASTTTIGVAVVGDGDVLAVSTETNTTTDGITANDSITSAVNMTEPAEPVDDDDMYTPKSSAWGVFQRPRDVSKTFGGGRVITRAEMDRMDDEYAARMKSGNAAKKLYISDIARVEDENIDKIKDAVSRSRNLMGMGNRQKAVEVLELIQPLISWHSELGGENDFWFLWRKKVEFSRSFVKQIIAT